MIPEHVLTAFHAGALAHTGEEALGPAWDNGVRHGSTVYSKANDTATWSARVRDVLNVQGVRLARPVRATDGRFVVSGWKASSFFEGDLERRGDETVVAALRLADALADTPLAPRDRGDVFAQAERDAWSLCDQERGAVDAPVQGGHADMAAMTLFSGNSAPYVTDLVPFAEPRPQGTTAALVAADTLIASAEEGVDLGIVRRFAHVPHFEELVYRCVVYRELVSARHPHANALTRSNIAAVKNRLMSS